MWVGEKTNKQKNILTNITEFSFRFIRSIMILIFNFHYPVFGLTKIKRLRIMWSDRFSFHKLSSLYYTTLYRNSNSFGLKAPLSSATKSLAINNFYLLLKKKKLCIIEKHRLIRVKLELLY